MCKKEKKKLNGNKRRRRKIKQSETGKFNGNSNKTLCFAVFGFSVWKFSWKLSIVTTEWNVVEKAWEKKNGWEAQKKKCIFCSKV